MTRQRGVAPSYGIDNGRMRVMGVSTEFLSLPAVPLHPGLDDICKHFDE
jgi:hypothetical protein